MPDQYMGGEMLYAWLVHGMGDAIHLAGTWRGDALCLTSTWDERGSIPVRCMGGEMLYAWPVYGRGDALCPVGTWRGVALRLTSTLDGKSSMGHGTWSMPSQYLEVLKLTSSDC